MPPNLVGRGRNRHSVTTPAGAAALDGGDNAAIVNPSTSRTRRCYAARQPPCDGSRPFEKRWDVGHAIPPVGRQSRTPAIGLSSDGHSSTVIVTSDDPSSARHARLAHKRDSPSGEQLG